MPLSPSDPIGRLVAGPSIATRPESTVRAVAELLAADEVGVVVIRGTVGPAGVFSERDLVRAVSEGADLDAERASDWMTFDPVTLAADQSIGAAARLMLDGGIRHLPIVDAGAVIGVASIRDVLGVYAPDGA